MKTNFNLYNGKTVLVTGHTGFKGSWLSLILQHLGANVVGYSLSPETEENLFSILNLSKKVTSVIADIRDKTKLGETFQKYKPEIVFHLAAQPLVRKSYSNPFYTYDVNVNGTLNVLDAIQKTPSVKSFINVTTDKVYKNEELNIPFEEGFALDGYDPYSNSKSCSDLITQCYKRCFFDKCDIAVSTVRAGNVIGGGDFAEDRIIPDCVRAARKHESIVVRNPNSIRPYQHVLEPLFAYLWLALEQLKDHSLSGSYNIGPRMEDCVSTKQLVEIFCANWGEHINWKANIDPNSPHESNFLRLSCSKLNKVIGWKPQLNIKQAISLVCEWSKVYLNQGNIEKVTLRQIDQYTDLISDIR